MKIISKYKDYYDYLTGIYGIDELLVYDRRPNKHRDVIDLSNYIGQYSYSDDIIRRVEYFICNKRYTTILYCGREYHGVDELAELFSQLIKQGVTRLLYDRREWDGSRIYCSYAFDLGGRDDEKVVRSKAEKFYNEYGVRSTNVNKEEREPVLVSIGRLPYKLPILSTSQAIPRHIAPDVMYQEISMFLGWLKDNPSAPDISDNNVKIQQAGFDVKDSFRPNKKTKQ